MCLYKILPAMKESESSVRMITATILKPYDVPFCYTVDLQCQKWTVHVIIDNEIGA